MSQVDLTGIYLLVSLCELVISQGGVLGAANS